MGLSEWTLITGLILKSFAGPCPQMSSYTILENVKVAETLQVVRQAGRVFSCWIQAMSLLQKSLKVIFGHPGSRPGQARESSCCSALPPPAPVQAKALEVFP